MAPFLQVFRNNLPFFLTIVVLKPFWNCKGLNVNNLFDRVGEDLSKTLRTLFAKWRGLKGLPR